MATRDIQLWPENDRTITAAVVLQLYGGCDPDTSRSLGARLLHEVDRVAMRGHRDGAATEHEVVRAQNALHRRGHAVPAEDVAYALDAAFIRGWQ
jgi:hypothetical protein